MTETLPRLKGKYDNPVEARLDKAPSQRILDKDHFSPKAENGTAWTRRLPFALSLAARAHFRSATRRSQCFPSLKSDIGSDFLFSQ